jgi:hypothetical protein
VNACNWEIGFVAHYKVFISHGTEDEYIVRTSLLPDVKSSGAIVFLDAEAIPYGDDFRRIIFEELEACHELLVFISPSSINRPWVFAELGASIITGKKIVAVTYSVPEEDMRERGVHTLLGTTKIVKIKDFPRYAEELQERVKVHRP